MRIGVKYCHRFAEKAFPNMTDEGQHWLRRTQVCLMEDVNRILVIEKRKCSRMENRALNSHVDCYQKNGYCDLSQDDKGIIFSLFDKKELNIKNLWFLLKLTYKCRK